MSATILFFPQRPRSDADAVSHGTLDQQGTAFDDLLGNDNTALHGRKSDNSAHGDLPWTQHSPSAKSSIARAKLLSSRAASPLGHSASSLSTSSLDGDKSAKLLHDLSTQGKNGTNLGRQRAGLLNGLGSSTATASFSGVGAAISLQSSLGIDGIQSDALHSNFANNPLRQPQDDNGDFADDSLDHALTDAFQNIFLPTDAQQQHIQNIEQQKNLNTNLNDGTENHSEDTLDFANGSSAASQKSAQAKHLRFLQTENIRDAAKQAKEQALGQMQQDELLQINTQHRISKQQSQVAAQLGDTASNQSFSFFGSTDPNAANGSNNPNMWDTHTASQNRALQEDAQQDARRIQQEMQDNIQKIQQNTNMHLASKANKDDQYTDTLSILRNLQTNSSSSGIASALHDSSTTTNNLLGNFDGKMFGNDAVLSSFMDDPEQVSAQQAALQNGAATQNLDVNSAFFSQNTERGFSTNQFGSHATQYSDDLFARLEQQEQNFVGTQGDQNAFSAYNQNAFSSYAQNGVLDGGSYASLSVLQEHLLGDHIHAHIDESNAQLSIDLGDLGQLAVSLQINDRVTDVSLHGDAAQHFSDQRQDLAQSLAQEGLSLGQFASHDNTGSQANSQGQNQDQQQRDAYDIHDTVISSALTQAALSERNSSLHSVPHRARSYVAKNILA